MIRKLIPLLLFNVATLGLFGQTLSWTNREFMLHNAKASLIPLAGEQVLKVERDLDALPFDVNNLAATVDEPSYVKLKNFNFKNGVIEVKVLSQIQNPSPFEAARGFIGIAFRIDSKDSAYESIYLRPKNGRSENQFYRNHTVQYYSYPHYKFDRLRKESEGLYETYADIGLNEWITLRIEVADSTAKLFINNQKYPSFIVANMKGKTTEGSIALWVDIGTTGYFKDLKITQF